MLQKAKHFRFKKLLALHQLLSRLLIPVFSFFLFFSLSLLSFPVRAQDIPCEEVPFTLQVKEIGSTELFSLVCEEEVYISIPALFDFLKIRNIPSDDFTGIEGYLLNQNDPFTIDVNQMELVYRGKTIALKNGDLRKTPTNLYLKSNYFGAVFQLDLSSSIRTMSIEIDPDVELPFLRKARREKLRENLRQLKTGVVAADTSLSKESALFRLGVADWDINLNQRSTGKGYNSFNLGLGGLLAGGEFSSRLNYNSNNQFDPQNQFYRWNYVNNNNAALRQIGLGKIGTRSISTLFRPVVGFQLTNAPTYLKRSFGTYELSDYTEANWMVELYINGVLVDFKQADAAGFFSFDVPLVYGSTDISLRYYGPYGEEEIVEKQFEIPFVFMPKNEFEYSLYGGLVEDGKNTVFAQARMNYGLTRSISLGGGVEYLSSLEEHSVMPFLNAAVRLPQNMLFSAEYIHNVGFKGDFSYTSPSNLRLELKYEKYEEEQRAVRFNFLEERELLLSTPFQLGKFRGSSRLRIRQNILSNSSYFNPEWFLSIHAYRINFNLTTNAFLRDNHEPLIYSRLSSSIMLPKQITFTPQLDYEYNSHSLNALQGQLRRRIFRGGYLRTSYGYNFKFDDFSFSIGLNVNVDFSRFGLSSTSSKRERNFTETAGGSLLFGPSLSHNSFSHRSSLDRAHVKFRAFLDVNGNGLKDKEERELEGIEVTSSSGGDKEKVDGAILFKGMEPYMEHHFTINTDQLNRIAWRVRNKRLNVYLNPNQMRLVEIPVSVEGEVSGFVIDLSGNGIGGIKIQILDGEQQLVKQIISEPDGFFSYLGLESGNYKVQLDSVQLKNLELKSNDPLNFQIRNTEEGDYIDNLQFILSETSKKENTFTKEVKNFEGEHLQEKTSAPVKGAEDAAVATAEGEKAGKEEVSTAIGNDSPAESARENALKNTTGERVVSKELDLSNILASEREKALIRKGLYYKVQILTSEDPLESNDKRLNGLKIMSSEKTDFGYRYTYGETRLPREAARLQEELRRSGFKDAFVVHYYNGKRIPVAEALAIRNGNIKEAVNPVVVTPGEIENSENRSSKKEQESLNFKVQIAASKVQLNPADMRFMGIEGIEEYRHEGMYKYATGNFRFFSEANQFKNALREQGIKDAFVVPFQDNKRINRGQARGYIYFKDSSIKGIGGISLQIFDVSGRLISTILSEADGSFITPNLQPGVYTLRLDGEELTRIGMKMETMEVFIRIDEDGYLQNPGIEFYILPKDDQLSDSSSGNLNEGLIFKVQVLASVPKLPVNHPLLKGLKDVERYNHRGLFKYTVGETTQLEEIRKVRDAVLRQGFEDAFIVPFLNGVRVNLQEMTGQIILLAGNENMGLEGVNLDILDKEGKQVTHLVSGRDGRISFIGLRPERYTARLDKDQLKRLGLRTANTALDFQIQRNTEGKMKDPIIFHLEKIASETPQTEQGDNSIEYRIQLAASNVPLGPNHPTLKGMGNVSLYRHNGMYKYTVGSTYSLLEAKSLMKKLEASHKYTLFIVGFKQGKRVMVVE